jgi:glycosyltransferase involved in cell wall biosynthesis
VTFEESAADSAAVLASSPLLSVTVTNYNYARFLPRAIDSILAQTFEDFELVIIDNASTDGSLALIHTYASRNPKIRVIAHERNQGALASLRESCAVARGRYRVHVDADDWVISPTAFERQVSLLEANPGVSFVYSCMVLFGASEDSPTNISHPYPRDVILTGVAAFEAILGFNITHSGMMFRLDSYRRTGGYPDGFPVCDDILLALRLCEEGDVAYIDDQLFAFRQHGANHHLAPRLGLVKDEILPMIELVFNGPLGRSLEDARTVRRRAVRRALVHEATHHIFSGRRRLGWRLYWESVKARPWETVVQMRTIALMVRSVIGGRGYHTMAQQLQRARARFNEGPRAEVVR